MRARNCINLICRELDELYVQKRDDKDTISLLQDEIRMMREEAEEKDARHSDEIDDLMARANHSNELYDYSIMQMYWAYAVALISAGFFVWNFWDTESMTNPFMQGTYLGSRSVSLLYFLWLLCGRNLRSRCLRLRFIGFSCIGVSIQCGYSVRTCPCRLTGRGDGRWRIRDSLKRSHPYATGPGLRIKLLGGDIDIQVYGVSLQRYSGGFGGWHVCRI